MNSRLLIRDEKAKGMIYAFRERTNRKEENGLIFFRVVRFVLEKVWKLIYVCILAIYPRGIIQRSLPSLQACKTIVNEAIARQWSNASAIKRSLAIIRFHSTNPINGISFLFQIHLFVKFSSTERNVSSDCKRTLRTVRSFNALSIKNRYVNERFHYRLFYFPSNIHLVFFIGHS